MPDSVIRCFPYTILGGAPNDPCTDCLALSILQSNEECINRILTSRKESAKIVNRTAYTIYACDLEIYRIENAWYITFKI